jgi:Fe-S-cluster containining protein
MENKDISNKLSHLMSPEEFTAELDRMMAYLRDNDMVASIPMKPTKQGVDAFFAIFKCQQCGACCHKMPDSCTYQYVFFSIPEYHNIKHLLTRADKKKFIPAKGGFNQAYPCTFYNENQKQCGVYERRPLVCRMYPLSANANNKVSLNINTFCPGAFEAAKVIYQSWYKVMNNKVVENMTFTCPICKEVIPDLKKLTEHLQDKHKEEIANEIRKRKAGLEGESQTIPQSPPRQEGSQKS